METKLYVGNLNFRTTDESLAAAFAEAGFEVVSAKIITDRETGRSRGFAFVEMADEKSAETALSTMHDRMVDGRPLKVTEAKPRGASGYSAGGAGPQGGSGDRGGFRSTRPRPAFDDRGPRPTEAMGREARPRFGADTSRPPREGGFGGARGGYGGGYLPPQAAPPPDAEEAGREGRRDRSKRRDLSKQHAERQDFDDDDGWE